jgi:hypothetical protein
LDIGSLIGTGWQASLTVVTNQAAHYCAVQAGESLCPPRLFAAPIPAPIRGSPVG